MSDILANDQISKAEAYKPLVIGYHNGAVVRLTDVADVVDSQQTLRQAGFLNGKPSVSMLVWRQPGANIITTVDLVKASLPKLEATMPRGEHLVTVLDRTLTIRASVSDIEWTLLISVLLVIGVVFVFLRNARATLIPAVAVPVSLIGTCAVMYLCNYSLDNLSPHGARHRKRLRRRRCNRCDGEHYPPSRSRYGARCRPPCRARRKSASTVFLHQRFR